MKNILKRATSELRSPKSYTNIIIDPKCIEVTPDDVTIVLHNARFPSVNRLGEWRKDILLSLPDAMTIALVCTYQKKILGAIMNSHFTSTVLLGCTQ